MKVGFLSGAAVLASAGIHGFAKVFPTDFLT